MAGLQQGRATSKRVFKKPKTFRKAEDMYKEVFDTPNKAVADDKIWAPRYSRVTHKQVAKIKKDN